MQKPWQHFRDKAAQMNDEEALRLLYSLLSFDTTAYIVGLLGATSGELLFELDKNPDLRKLARDTLATALFIGQSEKRHVPRSWFIGLHPDLNEESPAALFRCGMADEVIELLKSDGRIFSPLSV